MPAPETPESRSDQQLIAALNAGDAAAFEPLYFRYRDWVIALSHRFTGDESLALDVMQETFLYLLKKFPGFRLTAQMKTFLYPAVKNLSIAARRKTSRIQSTETEQHHLAQLPAAEIVLANSAELSAALANLSEDHREVLLLRFMDELSLAEIADTINVPLGTAKSRLHHALETLRSDARAKEYFRP